MSPALLLLLPFAAASGWFVSNRNQRSSGKPKKHFVPKDYLIGLNFLLEEQPDKAVDVFIKMLEVDSDTVETHLALGSLFRRRGEVDRAIRIHQNLIARPNLEQEQRMQALLALGQDYMRAGVLDRAERIFLEVVDAGYEKTISLRYLLAIYQQEKAWESAIQTARKLEIATGQTMQLNIAHYYCELAHDNLLNHDADQAKRLLRRAVTIDKNCVRASILQGDIEAENNNFKAAIRFYKQVKNQDPDFLTEAIPLLAECYEQLGNQREFINYLKECLQAHARISLILILADFVLKEYGTGSAIDLIAEYLDVHPSIRGLQRLIELQLLNENGGDVENLRILRDITTSMLKDKPIYRCHNCGFSAKTLLWLCPGCKTWSSVKPIHGLEGD